MISALLHITPADIFSAVIVNPIELGNCIDHKTFILDIKVSMHNAAILNLEMQVINEHNWTTRSLIYLCRNFDQLKAGEDYQEIRPVIQIGLLNFTLFPKLPEFYSTYKFLNVKNHTLYSDKLQLYVLDLTRIDLATMEDKQYQLDYRASLFRSNTWEELMMLAQKNKYIGQSVETIYQLSQEEKIRMQCEAREDYYRTQRGWQNMLKEKDIILKEKNALLDEKEHIIQNQKNKLLEQQTTIEKSASEYEKLLAWAKKHGYE